MTATLRTDILALARSGDLAQLAEAYVGPVTASTVVEPKYDGNRLLVGKEDGRVRVFARSGAEHTGKLARIEAELARLPDGTWLDGELVALEVAGDSIVGWGRAQSALGSTRPARRDTDRLTLMTFDVLAFGGHDARPLPLAGRRQFLSSIFDKWTWAAVALTPQYAVEDEAGLRAQYEAMVRAGFEGAMVKDSRAPYASAMRARSWQKMKRTETIDAFVIGYKDGESSFAGLVGAVEFGQLDAEGNVVERGRASGFDMATREHMSAHRAEYMGRVMEIRHMGVTDGGRLRHPVWVRWRQDKAAGECLLHDR